MILRSSNHTVFRVRYPQGQLFVTEPPQITTVVSQFLSPSVTGNDSESNDVGSVYVTPRSSPLLPSTIPRLDDSLLISIQSSELFADETAAALMAITRQASDADDDESRESHLPGPPLPTFAPHGAMTAYRRNRGGVSLAAPPPPTPVHVPTATPVPTPASASALVPAVTPIRLRSSARTPITHVATPALVAAPAGTAPHASVATVRADRPLPVRAGSELVLPRVVLPSVAEPSSVGPSTRRSIPTPPSPSPSQLSLQSSNLAMSESLDFSILTLDTGSSMHHNFYGTDSLALTVGHVQTLPTDSTSRRGKARKWVQDQTT